MRKSCQKPSFAQTKIKHEEQTGGSYWKYFFGGAVAAYLAKLFLDTAQQESAEKKKVSFDYSLDGELARSMSAKTFVTLLHKYGLTVDDAVAYQVKKKEEELYSELTELAQLDDHEWRMLQSLWQLKNEFLQGHYDENNITFKGKFDPQFVDMVKSVLQKADIPYQVDVNTKDTTLFYQDNWTVASVGHTINDLLWKINVKTAQAKFYSFGFFDVELYLSDELLKSDQQTKLAILAHESIHLLNMHHLEQIFFSEFLQYGKKFDENKINNCLLPLKRLHEYQADVLPLAVPEYAQARKSRNSYANRWFHKNTMTDIYIPDKELYTLASRAVELHEAEAKLFKINRIGDKK